MSYLELYSLVHTEGDLARRIEVACLMAAGAVLAESDGSRETGGRGCMVFQRRAA